MRRIAAILLLAGVPIPCVGASLVVDVRDPRGSAVTSAVVYAIRKGTSPPRLGGRVDQNDRRLSPTLPSSGTR